MMLRVWASLLLLSGAASLAAAGSRGHDGVNIEGEVRIPRALNPSLARVRLQGGDYEAIPREDGSFVLSDIPPGTYTFEVHHPTFTFETLRVDVSAKDGGRVRATSLVTGAKYFRPREAFDPWSILKNPTAVIMLITFGMVVIMPRMLNSMSPEELERMRKMKLSDLLKPDAVLESEQRRGAAAR